MEGLENWLLMFKHRLSSTDDEPFLLDQQAIREILEENRRLKEQLEQLLKS